MRASIIICPILWARPWPSPAASTHPLANTACKISSKSSIYSGTIGFRCIIHTVNYYWDEDVPEILLVAVVEEAIFKPIFFVVVESRCISFDFLESSSCLPNFEGEESKYSGEKTKRDSCKSFYCP
jgi:molybdopterin/thiamine biosynthesis adenylyltransferase